MGHCTSVVPQGKRAHAPKVEYLRRARCVSNVLTRKVLASTHTPECPH